MTCWGSKSPRSFPPASLEPTVAFRVLNPRVRTGIAGAFGEAVPDCLWGGDIVGCSRFWKARPEDWLASTVHRLGSGLFELSGRDEKGCPTECPLGRFTCRKCRVEHSFPNRGTAAIENSSIYRI